MNVTLLAAGKSAKRFLTVWLIGAVVVFAGLAIDTNFFTKKPSWTPWSYISPLTLPLGEPQ